MKKLTFILSFLAFFAATFLFVQNYSYAVAGVKQSPGVNFYYSWQNLYVGFDVSDFSRYKQLRYTISYTHDGGQKDAATGVISDLKLFNEVARDRIILGSCSTGGTCIYHKVESPVTLTIEFSKSPNKFVVHHKVVRSLN